MGVCNQLNCNTFFEKSQGILAQWTSFLRLNPALKGSLLLALSISLYIKAGYMVLFGAFFLIISSTRKTFFLHLLALGALLLGLYYHYGGSLPQKELEGVFRIHIQKMVYQSGFFGSNWVYSGVIKEAQGRKTRNLPFKLYLKKGSLDAHYEYLVEGTLKKSDFYGYSLKRAPDGLLKKGRKTWGLAAKRYEIQKLFKQFLKKKIPFKGAHEFLVGISTGDFNNNYLSFTFSRFGLNHILAISGFHFGLLLLFLNVILTPFLPLKVRTFALILILTGFYLFVGSGPSLARAWIVALIYLLGVLFEKPASAINTLSVAMLIILVLDPLMLTHLGFQFSFLVTFAILFFYSKVKQLLSRFFVNKHILDDVLLKAFALGLSVHIAAVPLTLYYFHKFYLLGFFYNLIIPALVSLLAFLLLTALALYPFLASLSNSIFYLDGYLTHLLLEGLYAIPTTFDYVIRVPYFPTPLLFVYLSLFLIGGSLSMEKSLENSKPKLIV